VDVVDASDLFVFEDLVVDIVPIKEFDHILADQLLAEVRVGSKMVLMSAVDLLDGGA
jgi:hypothetical protein